DVEAFPLSGIGDGICVLIEVAVGHSEIDEIELRLSLEHLFGESLLLFHYGTMLAFGSFPYGAKRGRYSVEVGRDLDVVFDGLFRLFLAFPLFCQSRLQAFDLVGLRLHRRLERVDRDGLSATVLGSRLWL